MGGLGAWHRLWTRSRHFCSSVPTPGSISCPRHCPPLLPSHTAPQLPRSLEPLRASEPCLALNLNTSYLLPLFTWPGELCQPCRAVTSRERLWGPTSGEESGPGISQRVGTCAWRLWRPRPGLVGFQLEPHPDESLPSFEGVTLKAG